MNKLSSNWGEVFHWESQGSDLQPLGFLIRDEELAGQRCWTVFDPDLPIDLLLSESQVMAQVTLHLAQPQIKAARVPSMR